MTEINIKEPYLKDLAAVLCIGLFILVLLFFGFGPGAGLSTKIICAGFALLLATAEVIMLYSMVILQYSVNISEKGLLIKSKKSSNLIPWSNVKAVHLQSFGDFLAPVPEDYKNKSNVGQVAITVAKQWTRDQAGFDIVTSDYLVIEPSQELQFSLPDKGMFIMMLRNGYENYMGTKKAIYIALDRYLDEKAIKNLPDLFRHFSIYVDTLPMAINTKDPQFYQEVLSRVK